MKPKICVFYSSPKLGDIILQLPFIKSISEKYQCNVTICVNKAIKIKNILQYQNYIDDVIENYFRKGKYFIPDIYKLYKHLKNENYTHAFILEKTKGPAIAAFLAGIKKIYGYGIGSQRFFVDNSFSLSKNDLRFNYTEQSKKFLSQFDIITNFNNKYLNLDKDDKRKLFDKFKNLPKPWICFGVDSTEINRIWPQENFAKLIDKIFKKNLCGTAFIISGNDHKDYFGNISGYSENYKRLINCKDFNRSELFYLIDICDYFIGIDSGPSCVAGALSKKTFCIFGPTDATLPRFKSMIKILSHYYDKKREVGNIRCGDNFDQTDNEVKSISVEKVFNTIIKNL